MILTFFQDQDTIDFTDNDLSSLGNFPFFPRLHTLLLARNRITHIQPALGTSVPHLSTLVLTSNNISELADLDPIRTLPLLTHLTLLENPVTRKEVSQGLSHSSTYSNIATELPVLDHLAGTHRALPRLPKGKGCRANQSKGTIRHTRGTLRPRLKDQGHEVQDLRRLNRSRERLSR